MADSTDNPQGAGSERPEEGPVFRDKRRIDPETGEVREPAGEQPGKAGPAEAEGGAEEAPLTVEDILAAAPSAEPEHEYLQDLKRVTAEYANYRKRVDANREAERERAVADGIKAFLPVLDDLDRAEKHGDLVEGSAFAAIAQKMRGIAERLGLSSFGVAGEAFDPSVHEAITQVPSPDASAPTVLEVFEKGYALGSTQLRAAKVVVAVPADG